MKDILEMISMQLEIIMEHMKSGQTGMGFIELHNLKTDIDEKIKVKGERENGRK